MNQFSNELNKKMTPVYVGKFNLTHQPFTNQFNSSLFYENEGRKIVLRKISHLLEFTKLILFIQGADGLGKTTLIRQRIRQTKDNWRNCFINAKDYTTPQSLISKISEDMKIKLSSHSNQESQAHSIQEQLEAMQQAGLTSVLYIDDIEQLNKSLIPTLSSLIQHTKDTQPKLRLVVVGHDIPQSLTDIIPADEKESTLKYLPLPPLTEKESTSYIKHRLNVSQYQYTEPFNKIQLKKIYFDSKGFPLYINQLADHLFAQYTMDYENKKPVIHLNNNTNKILKYVAGGLSFLIVVFIGYTLFETISEKFKSSDMSAEVKNLEIPVITEKQPVKLASAVKEKPKNEKKPVLTKKIITKNKPPVKTKPIPKVKIATQSVAKQIVKPAAKSITKTKITNNAKNKTLDLKTSKDKKGTDWIKSQNPKHFTLQLISGSNRAAAIKFIKKHGLQQDAAVSKKLRKGVMWYSVIYKSFKTTKEARIASKKLPKSLRRIKPWTRPFSAIQKDLK